MTIFDKIQFEIQGILHELVKLETDLERPFCKDREALKNRIDILKSSLEIKNRLLNKMSQVNKIS